MTTSAPVRSDSHHVRQMLPAPPPGSMAPATQITSTPTVAPSAVPAAAQTIRIEHVADAQARPARAEAHEQRGGDDEAMHGARASGRATTPNGVE